LVGPIKFYFPSVVIFIVDSFEHMLGGSQLGWPAEEMTQEKLLMVDEDLVNVEDEDVHRSTQNEKEEKEVQKEAQKKAQKQHYIQTRHFRIDV